MRTLGIALFIVVLVSALPAVSQDKAAKSRCTATSLDSSQLTILPTGSVEITPEMWFYEQQLREYLNPKLAVRRKAEFRARQRRHRIASMQWFGFSSLRPTASPDPWNGEYMSTWTGGEELHPYRWNGTSWTYFIGQ